MLCNFHLVPIYRFKDYEMASITLNMMKQNAQAAGVPMSVLAQIGGVRPTTLSSVFRGVMTLDSKIEARLHTVSCRVLEITQALLPLRAPDDANELGRLVVQIEDGRTTLDDIRAAVQRMFGQ
jgi:hypothetical protein